jgi:hypothetical protein
MQEDAAPPETEDETADDSEEGLGLRPDTDRRIVTQPYDFSIRTLVDSINEDSLIVQDVYQRNFVWDRSRSSRLIESLLLNIPIPVCYFAELDDGKQTVVDGHQRLQSIATFCSGRMRLRGLRVLTELNGKRFQDLEPKSQRLLQTRTLRCIVITRESDQNLRFDVFERLNTGAIGLNAQELRNCVYRGSLNDLLRDTVSGALWLRVSRQSERDDRMRDCELLLRFTALNDELERYRSPMKRFLNNYMASRRNPSSSELNRLRHLLEESLSRMETVFGTDCFRNWTGSAWEMNTNRAVFDTQLLTISSLPAEEVEEQRQAILRTFKYVSPLREFRDSTTLGTGDRAKLMSRLSGFTSALRDAGLHPQLSNRLESMD